MQKQAQNYENNHDKNSNLPLAYRVSGNTEIKEQYVGQTNVLLFFRIMETVGQLSLLRKHCKIH